MIKNEISFIDLSNYQEVPLIEGIALHPLVRARRAEGDSRGYLIEFGREDWDDLRFRSQPPQMSYSSFTYTGIARDEDMWHVHPQEGVEGGVEQIDRWSFWGRAIAVVADPRTRRLNLFKIGTGWGNKGLYTLLIPPHTYHGFLSGGGITDDEGKDGVIITNQPDKLYNRERPELIEGRVPYAGSGITFSDGTEFNWNRIREELNIRRLDS